MRIAYLRVSSKDQNLDRQRMILDEYNIEKFFEEKVSAKDTNRPELQNMLEFVREGDVLYITEFSRLARSVLDLLQISETLKRKKVRLVSVKEKINTGTAEVKVMVTVIGAIAEFERAIIRERQAEGIAVAKEKGVYAGRKPKPIPNDFNDWYKRWKNREITLVQFAKMLGVSRSTAYRLIHNHENK